jgi:hypothetical protein
MKNDVLNIKQRVTVRKEFGIHTTSETTERQVINQVKSVAKVGKGETVWHNKVAR